LCQAMFARLRGEIGVIFFFLSFGWEGWCTYACCIFISVSYHICMFASLYHRLHSYHMP
jgi:hypothetical protein